MTLADKIAIALGIVLGVLVTAIATKKWIWPAAGIKWLPYIDVASQQYQLPPNLLGRLLYEESAYREDIITGKKVSSKGALGIAQFEPPTARDYGIDPLDPVQAIDAAGHYLSDLYAEFGDWRKAIAAYDWGRGNVAAHGIDHLPPETAKYVADIAGDVGLA